MGSLLRVYGAITFILEHPNELDAYLKEQERRCEEFKAANPLAPAAKPPRSVFRNVAARFGRTIVYVPIGQLSPVTMKKIRMVHVLDGYDKRAIAKDVIW